MTANPTGQPASFGNALAGLAVSDLEQSIAWLTKVLGRGPDVRPMDGLADWWVGPDSVVQAVADPQRAGGSTITLVVHDHRAEIQRLAGLGITVTFDEVTSTKVSFASIEDPDGNNVTFVEPKPGFDPHGTGRTAAR